MRRLPIDIDIHTHSGAPRPDAVLCIDPVETPFLPDGDGFLSVGIHPWNADKADSETWMRLERWLDDERVVAIGEIGIDRLRGPRIEIQVDVFAAQIDMARSRGLPVVIHCVRAFDLLLAVRKKMNPTVGDGIQWILHGFRGKPALARQLLDAGIDLSYGALRNEAAFALTPPERRYTETD